MKTLLLCCLAFLFAQTGFTQSNSGISLTVTDEGGNGLINFPVEIYQRGKLVMTVYTDDDGNAIAKPLQPNEYEVKVVKGNVTRQVTGISIGIAETAAVDISFSDRTEGIGCIEFSCGPPNVSFGQNYAPYNPSHRIISGDQLDAMPVR